MDKTGLFYCMPSDRSLQYKQTAGTKEDKTHITLTLTTNADKSDIQKPLFIRYVKQLKCFNKISAEQYEFNYHFNVKAWMTGLIFRI